MIKLIRRGGYELRETARGTKVLMLDEKSYAWLYAKRIGGILATARKKPARDHLLASGRYRLYSVVGEPNLTDLQHLELSVGRKWQGYLLLTGLPRGARKRRIVPTDELIGRRTVI